MNEPTISFEIRQNILDVTNTNIIDSELVASFKTNDIAIAFLHKREYVYDSQRKAWYGKSLQYPIVIKKIVSKKDIFNIKSFM